MRRHTIKFYDDDELSYLWRCMDRMMFDPVMRPHVEFFRLALMSGGREAEIASLKLSDCHENYIEIQRGKGRNGGKYRTSDVHPLGLPYYHLYLREQQASNSQWLFPGRELTRHEMNKGRVGKQNHRIVHIRGPISTRTVRRWWMEFCQEIKLRYLELHSLRRTFATWCAEDLSKQDLQDQLGHVDDSYVTDQYYRASIPGRRFVKPEPEWKKVARAGGQKLLESQGVINLASRRIAE